MLLRTIFFIFLCSHVGYAVETLPLQTGLAQILNKNSDIVILGVTHNNPAVPNGVNILLKSLFDDKDPHNCLFVELPQDTRSLLNRVLENENWNEFWAALSKNVYLPVSKRAYTKFGLSKDQIDQLMTGPTKGDSVLSFNLMTLRSAKAAKASVIPFDALSNSEDFFNSLFVSIYHDSLVADSADPQKILKADRWLMTTDNTRNGIMSSVIRAQFSNHECKKALVVVGSAHLLSRVNYPDINTFVQMDSLQDQLKRVGYQTTVLLAGHEGIYDAQPVPYFLKGKIPESEISEYFGLFMIP